MKNYYLLDYISLEKVKIGSQEKLGLFTASFSKIQNNYVYAARQNGILWKADSITGVVKKSLRF
jgi:hypothetical protein